MLEVAWKGAPRVEGYCPWTQARVWAAIVSDEAPAVPGDFVIAGPTTDGGTLLVTSPVAARPYYWGRDARGRVFHGTTVFDVVQRAELPWRWNAPALRNLALLEHTLGDETLHPDVFRCPPATVMRFGPGGQLRQRRYLTPGRFFEGCGGPDAALEVLVDVVGELSDGAPMVSLSAGFDSRVLLAALLRRGAAPRCATMGPAHATDVQIAGRIARRFGLRHDRVELDPHDYLRYGQQAAEVTSGTKSARHFHTFIYTQKLGLSPEELHFVGSNGAFARTDLFDAGCLSLLADAVRWPLMHSVGLGRIALHTRGSAVRKTALGRGIIASARAWAKQATLPRGPLNRLDELRTFQRMRHFIGNGLAMYATATRVRAPFLDARWMRAVGPMSRRHKLGSNWHRFAIERLYPKLLAFGVDDTHQPMRPRAEHLYRFRRGPTTVYAPCREVLALPEVHDRIIETPELDPLIDRPTRIAATHTRDQPLMMLLLTLHFTVRVLRRRGIAIANA